MTDKLDISKLTLGEVAKVEELSGLAFDAMADGTKPKGKLLAAIGFIAKKRHDPSYSWNDAMALTMEDLGELVDFGDNEDEETAALEEQIDPKGEPNAAA